MSKDIKETEEVLNVDTLRYYLLGRGKQQCKGPMSGGSGNGMRKGENTHNDLKELLSLQHFFFSELDCKLLRLLC